MIKTLWIYAVSLRRMAFSTYQEREKKKTKREERKEQGEAGWVGGSAHRPSLERRPLGRAYESTYM